MFARRGRVSLLLGLRVRTQQGKDRASGARGDLAVDVEREEEQGHQRRHRRNCPRVNDEFKPRLVGGGTRGRFRMENGHEVSQSLALWKGPGRAALHQWSLSQRVLEMDRWHQTGTSPIRKGVAGEPGTIGGLLALLGLGGACGASIAPAKDRRKDRRRRRRQTQPRMPGRATIHPRHQHRNGVGCRTPCFGRSMGPQWILLNIGTPDSTTLLQLGLDIDPETRVIVFGLSSDRESEIVACAEAGVAGLHLRTESFAHLLALLRDVGNGRAQCSPEVSAILLRRVSPLCGATQPGCDHRGPYAQGDRDSRLDRAGLDQSANRIPAHPDTEHCEESRTQPARQTRCRFTSRKTVTVYRATRYVNPGS